MFKTHQQQLSTAQQGIINVPAQTHKTTASPTSKKLSPLKRLFSRKRKLESEASGSQLSIDYDQFCANEAGISRTGKRFSDGHINRRINFNAEGRLTRTNKVQLTVPVTQLDDPNVTYVENDLYNSSERIVSLQRLSSPRGLPVTSIDDVELESELQTYESVDDFVAI